MACVGVCQPWWRCGEGEAWLLGGGGVRCVGKAHVGGVERGNNA